MGFLSLSCLSHESSRNLTSLGTCVHHAVHPVRFCKGLKRRVGEVRLMNMDLSLPFAVCALSLKATVMLLQG